MYTSPLTEMCKELTTKEKAVVLEIMPFISYSDGVLRYNRQILDVKTMSELLGEDYEGLRRTISKLINKDILKKLDVVSDKEHK